MMRPRFVLAIVLLGVLTAANAGLASAQRTRVSSRSEYRSRVDTAIAFDKNGTVTVTAGSGDIFVTGISGSQVRVKAVSDDDNIRLDASSTRMAVEVSSNRRGSDARFEVSVPFGTRVIAKSQSGDVSVRGTRGEVEVHAQSGDVIVDDVNGRLNVHTLSGEITATNIAGDVEIGTTSGDLKLRDIRGNIEINNTSGDIDMRGVTAKLVRAHTTSGDVTYDGTVDPAGRYELESHSGDVHLRIPRDASAQLTVFTLNGEIVPDFPIVLKPGQHDIGASNSKQFTFDIGGGAARITAKTFSGDVTVSYNGRGALQRP